MSRREGKVEKNTLGSEIPRVWTRITRCKNFIAENLIPAFVEGDQTKSRIRALHAERVFQAEGLLRFVHLMGL